MKRKNHTEMQLFWKRFLLLPCILLSFSGCLPSKKWYGFPVKFRAYEMQIKTAAAERIAFGNISEKFIYLSFGYMECKGICPGTASSLYRLSKEIQDHDILFLFGEMMPEKNRIIDVQKKLSIFGERFTAFTADSEEEMRLYAGKFNEYFSSGGRLISHTGNIYLIDGSRNIRLVYQDTQRDTEKMKDDYDRLRKEYGRE